MRWWLHPVRTGVELADGFIAALLVSTVEAFDRAVGALDPGESYARPPSHPPGKDAA